MYEENSKNEAASHKRHSKMINWIDQVEKVEAYFKTVATRAKNEKYFENIYVSRNDNERQIQLFAGAHPIGNVEVKRDSLGRETGRRLNSEHGAGLVISQTTLGDVAIILYPYVSEKLRHKDDYIVWGIFSDPEKITERILKAAVNDFFIYIRVSSALFTESSIDRLRINYLSFRGQKFIGGGGIAKLVFSHWLWGLLGAIGSVASIYSVIPSKPIPQPEAVLVPAGDRLTKAISIAKMEGVKFSDPSAQEVVAKFFIRPVLASPLDSYASQVALVSVSPFRTSKSKVTFDAGDCRFLGNAESIDESRLHARIVINSISCTDNSSKVFTITAKDINSEKLGISTSLDLQTDSLVHIVKDGKTYTVPLYSNVLIRFDTPIKLLKYVGNTNERF